MKYASTASCAIDRATSTSIAERIASKSSILPARHRVRVEELGAYPVTVRAPIFVSPSAEKPGVQVAKTHFGRLVVGIPFMVAAASCIALLTAPGVVVGLVLAAMGFDVLRPGRD